MSHKAWLFCVLLAGCAFSQSNVTPVSLTLPREEASFDERLEAYKKLAPKQVGVIVVTSSNGGSSSTPYVTLQDNRSYYKPSALLGVVSDDTPMARLSDEREEAMAQRRKLLRVGLSIMAVGSLGLSAAGVAQSERAFVFGTLGSGALILGGLPFLIAGSTWKAKALTATRRAMLTYDFSLRQTLDICYDDLKEVVYDCKAPPSYLP
jgi:hypothetical protein